jgi:hypothetical protein
MAKLQVTKLEGMNLLVISQDKDNIFFVGTPDKIVISTLMLSNLLKFLVFNDYLSPKVLEGILSEYHTKEL